MIEILWPLAVGLASLSLVFGLLVHEYPGRPNAMVYLKVVPMCTVLATALLAACVGLWTRTTVAGSSSIWGVVAGWVFVVLVETVGFVGWRHDILRRREKMLALAPLGGSGAAPVSTPVVTSSVSTVV